MKKFLVVALCLCMVLGMAACNKPAEAAEKSYKLGMGVVVSTASSKTDLAQIDATVATVVLDADGKIVACRIDVAQNQMNVKDGAVEADKTFETKMELGDRYGMAGKVDNDGNGVKLEWYEQAKAFEAYVVGMTVAQVEAIQTQTLQNGYVISADEALLNAGCSMQITDFIAAVAAACKDEQSMSFKTSKTFTLGVAAKTTAADSVAATADKDGTVAMYTDFAAAVIADGKIIATLNDAIQPKIAINTKGEIIKTDYTATKRVLKEAYNMATYGASQDNDGDGRVLEWYVQSEAFSKFVVGKTGAEVAAMQTKTLENGYKISADDALLKAGCTIQITGICAVVAQSAANAR